MKGSEGKRKKRIARERESVKREERLGERARGKVLMERESKKGSDESGSPAVLSGSISVRRIVN